MIDAVGLINMNGRIQDPVLGKFLSADPNIQDPGDSQSFNRYSYVQNRPLSATDPSGFDAYNFCSQENGCNNVLALKWDPYRNSWYQQLPGKSSESDREITVYAGPRIYFDLGADVGNLPTAISSLGLLNLGVAGGTADIPAASASVFPPAASSSQSPAKAQAAQRNGNDPKSRKDAQRLAQNEGERNNSLLVPESEVDRLEENQERYQKEKAQQEEENTFGRDCKCDKPDPGFDIKDPRPSSATPAAARRGAMRDAGIPTSQQPTAQGRNDAGRWQVYERPGRGGKTEFRGVVESNMDRSHIGERHYEAGSVKTDGQGRIRFNQYGAPKLENVGKFRVWVEDDK